ncbi:hypothetical protein [Archangium sp.]|uniref:hypothetical protein n=1 Tax=Archangium sp. TaxID=1872627 RepID=UPI002D50A9C1|nr:hypothetical protein [Archangium sp.]HYO54883.1 hypothetical protein [Archangium sp.]
METAATRKTRRTRRGTAVLLLLATMACGPVDEAPERQEPASQAQEVKSTNGGTLNGLAFNGLAFNGLAFNGLNSGEFSSWFNQDESLAEVVMRYIVTCAVPDGETRTFTDGMGRTYVWEGALGLAPDWASGQPANGTEQQLVSACLAAHVNKYGRSVAISVQGRDAHGQPIPTSQAELQEFSQREGCFFGNLFTPEGLFVGNDDTPLGEHESSIRACALGREGDCAPIAQVGSCAASCTPDPTNTYYTQCTRNGITYAPITTRIHPQDIYVCGDSTCQFTESCGIDLDTMQCTLDCGLCIR